MPVSGVDLFVCCWNSAVLHLHTHRAHSHTLTRVGTSTQHVPAACQVLASASLITASTPQSHGGCPSYISEDLGVQRGEELVYLGSWDLSRGLLTRKPTFSSQVLLMGSIDPWPRFSFSADQGLFPWLGVFCPVESVSQDGI